MCERVSASVSVSMCVDGSIHSHDILLLSGSDKKVHAYAEVIESPI